MARLPNQIYKDWYEGTKAEFPVGTSVRASAAMLERLSKSKPGRKREELVGVVTGYDDIQCRILVRWPHPEYADLPDERVPSEPLAPNFLEAANG